MRVIHSQYVGGCSNKEYESSIKRRKQITEDSNATLGLLAKNFQKLDKARKEKSVVQTNHWKPVKPKKQNLLNN